MGGIVKLQVKIYVENLIYYGYVAESYVDGMVTVTDKAYDDLFKIDKILSNKKNSIRGLYDEGAPIFLPFLLRTKILQTFPAPR